VSDDQATDQGTESHVSGDAAGLAPGTLRQALEAHAGAGWPTPEVPDWLAGGYVTKERLFAVLLVIADYVDRATGHPDAVPEVTAATPDERTS
jgi:hypothetical protein